MLQEGSRVVDEIGSTWDCATRLDWARGRSRVTRHRRPLRAALDAEEAQWLREAERLQIWRPLGMVSAIDYLERVLGYTPHAAKERLVSREDLDAHHQHPRSQDTPVPLG